MNADKTEKKFAYVGNYQLVQLLGLGGQAKVKLGIHGQTGQKLAIKIFKHQNMSQAQLQSLQNEIINMQNLKHKNIINLEEVLLDTPYIKKNGQQYQCIALGIEIADKEDLFSYSKLTGKFSEQSARYFFKQILEGLNYMHSKQLSHRDLKPENLLLDGEFNVKIADFGYSQVMGKNQTGFLHTKLGTFGYMAPELYQSNAAYVGVNVDVYALGVILFIMVAGFPPISNALPDKCIRVIYLQNLDYDGFWQLQEKQNKEQFDPDFKDLIQNMLAYRGQTRISISEIINHPWLQKECLTQEQIKQEFDKKNSIIKQTKEIQKLEKIKQKLENQQKQNPKQENQDLQFVGVKAYRGDQEITLQKKITQSDIEEMKSYHQNLLNNNRQVKQQYLEPTNDTILTYEQDVNIILVNILKFLDENQITSESISDDHYKVRCQKNDQHFNINILYYEKDDVYTIQLQNINFEFTQFQQTQKKLEEYVDQYL